KRASVFDQLGFELQHIRNYLFFVPPVGVAALAQHVEEQDPALPGVEPVVLDRSERSEAGRQLLGGRHHTLLHRYGGELSSACSTARPTGSIRPLAPCRD